MSLISRVRSLFYCYCLDCFKELCMMVVNNLNRRLDKLDISTSHNKNTLMVSLYVVADDKWKETALFF